MIAFWILALAMIASAVFIITAKKPVYSVVGLLANFIALAITYLTLHAEFIAVIQIVVYSGAILILFLFVIALLSSGTKPFDVGPDKMPKAVLPAAIVTFVALGFVLVGTLRDKLGPAAGTVTATSEQTGAANAFGSVADFGTSLFSINLLPFEVTSFILMVAVIGVVLLAGDDTPPRKTGRKEHDRESIVKRESITR
jgi:NADH-quinone oxidoreductase subunit J